MIAGATERIPEHRILIVDDEPDLLDELMESLRAAGWNVEGAPCAMSAWEKLTTDDNLTVLLTDIRMPGMDGLGLAKQVCQRRGDANATEVVLLTGHGTLSDAAEAVRIGAFDFLTKPIGLKALLDATERAHLSATKRRMREAERAAELELLRAERQKLQQEVAKRGGNSDFSGGVPREFSNILSHEMRTPLVALMAVPELLTQATDLSPAEVTDNLSMVRKAGARLTEIADDFVELLAPPDPNSFDIRSVAPDLILDGVKLAMNAAVEAAGQELVLVEMADGQLETDFGLLVKAICRLVANAIIWNAPAGTIVISAYLEEGEHIVFEVADRGHGMTPEELAIARQPFRQLDMSLSRRVGGLGLGLPLAEQMAGLLGGRLRIISTPADGTRASIILPRAQSR